MSKKKVLKAKKPRVPNKAKAEKEERRRCPICFRYRILMNDMTWGCVIGEHNTRLRQIMRDGESQPDYDPDQYVLQYGSDQVGFHLLHPQRGTVLCGAKLVRVGEMPDVVYARPQCPECIQVLAQIEKPS